MAKNSDVTQVDLESRFDSLKSAIPAVVQDLLTVQGRKRALVPRRVWIEDMDPENAVDKAKLKDTKLHLGTWKIPVFANVDLVDTSTGAVIARNERLRVADIPRPTPHQSMLINGVEYHPHAQLRLKPGVYVRQRQTGDISAQFNFAKTKETRIGFDLQMNPADGIFYISIGQSNVGLYPILSSLGVADEEMERAWGSQILDANRKKFRSPETQVSKFGKVLTRGAAKSKEEIVEAAKAYFGAARLDPDITEMTLGQRHEHVTPASLLAASRKMILVNRGEAEADDRDALKFKKIVTYDEHVIERLHKAKPSIQGKLKYRIEAKDSPREAILRADLNRPIEQHLTGMTGLASAPEQLNPVGLMAENMRVVATGEGGLSDLNIITESARNVHPSQAGFIDPVPTSQSKAAGVALNLALGARKKGSDFATEVHEIKTGNGVYLTPADIDRLIIGMPDGYVWKNGKPRPKGVRVMAMKYGKLQPVTPAEVTHIFSSPKAFFGIGSLLTPFMGSTQGNRLLMAANQSEQVIPLKDPDQPLVQSRLVGSETAEQILGRLFSVRAPIDGTVSSVSRENISIKPRGGGRTVKVSTYDNYPLNTGFLDSKPRVSAGDGVKKGQLIADTTHTKDGVLALGANLRTGYLSMKGLGFEDAIVVSESAAKKLTSSHIHRFSSDLDDHSVLSKTKFDAAFPAAMNNQQRGKLDDDAVIKRGERVTKGDVIIGLMRMEEATPEDIKLGRVYRKLARPWKDRSHRWTSDYDGVVTDVVKQPGYVGVFIRTDEALRVGDKLVGRHGNKGVVSVIVPDGEMPVAESGRLDIVLNPTTVPSRLNPSQILETAMGKAAEKSGTILVVDDFEERDDNVVIAKRALKKAGFDSDREPVKDPTTGVLLGNVAVGIQHILKLEHQADHKFSARNRGAYDVNMQPVRGGPEGSSAVSHLEMNALLAHGARSLLRDVATYKGEKNDEFWRAVQTGRHTPPPNVPFVFNKFLAYLKGAGINVEQQGSVLQVVPVTDEQIDAVSSGQVTTADMLMAKDLKEIKGGLFDEKVTGGVAGTKFSHVDLVEPVVNPSMKRAIRTILGLKEAELNAIAGGSKKVRIGGKEMTGGMAVKSMLSNVDVDSELSKAREEAKKSTGDSLDKLNRKIRYLSALKERKISPADAYTITKVPVIPPIYRPIYPLPSGELRPSGINLLIADVIHVNNAMRELKSVDGVPEKYIASARKELQATVDAAFGFGNPLPSTRFRAGGGSNLRGLAADIFGPRPKEGFFQDKVWRKQQDLSGRAVVVPNPSLGMDEVEIPEEMAWKIFHPFVVKELVSLGTSPVEATKEVDARTPRSRSALERVMEGRPVTFTRAPALHKFSFLSAFARPTKDKVIKTPPLIVTGLNLDHDGDSSLGDVCVIISNDAVLASLENKMPHAGKIAGSHIIDLAEFPRVEETIVTKPSGVVEYDVPGGVSVPSYCPKTGRFVNAVVTKFSIHPNCREWIVKSRRKRTLVVSESHSLALMNPDTLCVEKSVPRDAVGRCFPVLKSGGEEPVVTSLHGLKPERGCWQTHGMAEKVDLDFEAGWLFGAFIGDGWSSEMHDGQGATLNFSWGLGGESVKDRFERGVSRWGGGKGLDRAMPHEWEGGSYVSHRWTMSNTWLARFFRKHCGHGAENKHLPVGFLMFGLDVRRGLFCGMLDTDGALSLNRNGRVTANMSTISERLAYEIKLLAMSLGIPASITEYEPRGENRQKSYIVNFSAPAIADADWIELTHETKIAGLLGIRARHDFGESYNDIVPMTNRVRDELLTAMRDLGGTKKVDANAEAFSWYVTLKKNRPFCVRKTAQLMMQAVLDAGLPVSDYMKHWHEIVLDESVGWDVVESSEPTGEVKTMYDITVPETLTFTMGDGAVVWDTMSVHVPVTREAVEDAMKMLPSRNLILPSTGQSIMIPTMEAVLGTYLLTEVDGNDGQKFASLDKAETAYKAGKVRPNKWVTIGGKKTTVGRELVRRALGAKYYDGKSTIGKKELRELTTRMAKEDPNIYSRAIKDLSQLAHLESYLSGFSVGVDDLDVSRDARDEFLQAGFKALHGSTNPDKIVSVFGGKIKELDQKLVSDVSKRAPNNAFLRMSVAGAKGGAPEMRQILWTPLMVEDNEGRPVPVPIQRSYAEGLSLSDYWATTYGARKGVIDKSLEVQVPGVFAKRTIAASMDIVVTMEDCGTMQGIKRDVDDPDIISRYLARPAGSMPRNTIITPQVVQQLRRAKAKEVLVRSVLRCEAPAGVCKKCYGIMQDGKLPEVGANVGVENAQYVSEPATQAQLKSFHTGGAVGAAFTLSRGFPAISAMLNMPKHIQGQSTLSTVNGKVDAVKEAPAGGWLVSVDGKDHYVPFGLKVTVKPGTKVAKGQTLSTGIIHPREKSMLTDVPTAQEQLVNDLSEQYQVMGKPLQRRVLETVVRGITNYVRVLDPGEHESWEPGDNVALPHVIKFNTKARKPVVFEPSFKGLQQAPLSRPDWLARLGSTNLRVGLEDSVSRGLKSDVHGPHPLPGLVFGKDFAKFEPVLSVVGE